MPQPFVDFSSMGTSLLIEQLVNAATERGCLISDDAPEQELNNIQRRIDRASEELLRRMSW